MANKSEKRIASVVIFKMQFKKQQSFAIQHRELYSISYKTTLEKNQKNKKEYRYIYIYI